MWCLLPKNRRPRSRCFYLLVTTTCLFTITLIVLNHHSHDDDLLKYPIKWPEFELILPYLETKQIDRDFFLVVVVNSAATGEKHRSLRTTIRETWGDSSAAQNERQKWKLFFALGRSVDPGYQKANLDEAAVYNDVIIGNFTDVHNNVVKKMYMSHVWAISRFNCKYILKSEDDVYIRVNRLVSWLVDTKPPTRPFYDRFVSPYLEVPRNPKSEWFITYEQYGGRNLPPLCHVLSTDIISNIQNFTMLKRPILNNDAFIEVTMIYLGTQAIQMPGVECELLNAIAIGHKVDPIMMRILHAFYRLSTENVQCSHLQSFMNRFYKFWGQRGF